MNLDEALEKSREDFEINFAIRYYRILKRQGLHPSEEERKAMRIRQYYLWDSKIRAYCPSVHDTELQPLQHEWRIWRDAFIKGWEARDSEKTQ